MLDGLKRRLKRVKKGFTQVNRRLLGLVSVGFVNYQLTKIYIHGSHLTSLFTTLYIHMRDICFSRCQKQLKHLTILLCVNFNKRCLTIKKINWKNMHVAFV